LIGVGGIAGGAVTGVSADHETEDQYPAADRFHAADSSNYTDSDRHSGKVDWIVLHSTVCSDKCAEDTFQDPDSDVSAHYIVSNYDDTEYQPGSITQMVFNSDTAWHARCANSYSIGIEHEWIKGRDPVGEACYDASAELVNWLCDEFNIRKVVVSNDEFDGQTPWCSEPGGIVAHRDSPDRDCNCDDTIATRCPDPRGFGFDVWEGYFDKYR
jgi:hypothetical protein